MKKISFAFLFFFLTTSLWAFAQTKVSLQPKANSVLPLFFSALNKENKADYKTLNTADAFKSRSVGYGGITPEEVKAMWRLLKLSNAKEIFSSLQSTATLPGQIYSYCGLVLLGESGTEEKTRLSSIEEVIDTQQGCLGMGEKVSDIMKQLDCNAYKENL